MVDSQPRRLEDFGELTAAAQPVHWLPDEDQRPVGFFAKGLVYIEIIAGWLLSLLAVAGLSGIIKND